MKKTSVIAAVVTSAVISFCVGAGAAELPTYELAGFPFSPHQLSATRPANVVERSPVPTLTFGGMPASPHQIAVLKSRTTTSAQLNAERASAP